MKPILQLKYNSASLPPPYTYSYTLYFYETGYAEFILFTQNLEEKQQIFEEKKKFDLIDLKIKIQNLENFISEKPSELMIGGESRTIILNLDGMHSKIEIFSPNGIEIFNRLVKIYDPDFETKKAEKLNF